MDIKQRTGIAALKIKHNGVLGYHIEVPAKHGDALMKPDSGFTHRQTMAGAVRFNAPELHEVASRVTQAGAHAVAALGTVQVLEADAGVIGGVTDHGEAGVPVGAYLGDDQIGGCHDGSGAPAGCHVQAVVVGDVVRAPHAFDAPAMTERAGDPRIGQGKNPLAGTDFSDHVSAGDRAAAGPGLG